MFGRNLAISVKGIVVLLGIIGGINLLISTTALSPGFSTTSNLLRGIEQFLAPSGYNQARQDPSFAVHISFSELGSSPFEPARISIPSGMGVIWFNEDDSEHSVTFNSTSPEAINSGNILPGGFFIHRFTTPGTYDYYDSADPSVKGRIKVGSEFESGQNMDMLVGGDALPFQAGKVGRTTFSFVPHSNVISIPPTLSITYGVTVVDANGTRLYSNQFDDSDGILDLELIPSRGLSSYQAAAASNQTAAATSSQAPPQFVTWGPDLTDQTGVASDGVYHVQGPVLTKNETYTITVSIASIGNTMVAGQPSDSFMLPASS